VSDVPVNFVNPAIQNLVEFANEIELIGSESKTTKLKKLTATRSINDDETDFDSIYEFLEQFEKIYKSKKSYDKTLGYEFEFDIKQIQIVLNFLTGSDLEINGKYDEKTENVVADFQNEMGITETGICDTETLEEMFYKLKVKGFDEEDLSKFIKGQFEKGETILGILDISRAGLSSEQKSNVDLLIKYMEENGITNVYAKVGILSVIGKESGFIPKNEVCYDNTSNGRIISIFGNCRLNAEKLEQDFGMTLDELKLDCEKFFDAVYGPKATDCLGWATGNDNEGDGYKYIGRGFNQITFKANYQKYGDAVGMDLVSDPDQLNDVNVAAEAAVAFLTKGKSVPDFKSKEEATNYFLDVNAGGRNGRSESRQKAFEWMNKFEVK
jgi:predicted chitinase